MQKPSFDKCKEREFFYVYKYCIALVNFMVVRVGGIFCLNWIHLDPLMPTPLKRPTIKPAMNVQKVLQWI